MQKSIEILQEFEEKEWVTKEGSKVKIKNLELSHSKIP